jgi:hypothetical protein
LQSNFFAGKTAIRQKGYVPFLDEPSERFTHGSATDTETVAEFLMVHFLARHDLVAQNQVLDLGVDAARKIFGGARFGFRFSQGVGHRITLHKKVYAMPRNLSDWFFVVNEGRLNLQKAVKMISAISVFTGAAQGAKFTRESGGVSDPLF